MLDLEVALPTPGFARGGGRDDALAGKRSLEVGERRLAVGGDRLVVGQAATEGDLGTVPRPHDR